MQLTLYTAGAPKVPTWGKPRLLIQ